ncbi:MAG: hypothetical protein AAGK21_17320 [Bacteroidota bacterium]
MQTLRALTDAAVHDAALFDGADRGTTTTLDVKRVLRDRGYWATQAEVSHRMDRIARREQWPWWKMLGRFRLYGVPVHRHASGSVAARAALVN